MLVLCNNNKFCRGSTLKLSLLLLYLHSQDKDPICWLLASARLPLLGFSLICWLAFVVCQFCLCRLFSVSASSGLFLCICLCQAFSVFASSGRFVMLSVGWQYLQSCSLVFCVLAGYAGYHGYALPEARVCWGDCRGSLWAVGQPPEVPGP